MIYRDLSPSCSGVAMPLLLRVRLTSATGSTLKLRVEPSLTYEELVKMAASEAGITPSACELSLNKKSPIPCAAPGVSVAQLGLAHGDLIYLVDRAALTTASPAYASPVATNARMPAPGVASPSGEVAQLQPGVGRLVAMGYGTADAAAALTRASGSVARATELLAAAAAAPGERMVVDSEPLPLMSTPVAPRHPSPRSPSGPSPDDTGVPPTEACSGGSSSWASVSPSDTREPAEVLSHPAQRVDAMHDVAVAALVAAPAPLPPSTLVPQSLVHALGTLLASSGAEGPHEPLVVAMHAMLVQSGFVTTTPSLAATGVPPPLPPGWRATPGLYTLQYRHTRHVDGPLTELKCVPMGPTLLVHAMLLQPPLDGESPPALLSWQLASANHALTRGGAAGTRSLLKLPKLMHAFSAALLQARAARRPPPAARLRRLSACT